MNALTVNLKSVLELTDRQGQEVEVLESPVTLSGEDVLNLGLVC